MKVKYFLVLSTAVCMALTACNNVENKPEDLTVVKNDSTKFTSIQWKDSAVDFGAKKMGEVVDITFTCTNTGNKPLYLYDVRPGCGCTVADYTKEPIAPGKEGKVEARFDTKKAHAGEVHKRIYIKSNNSNPAPKELLFSGTVMADSSATAKK